MKVLAVQDCGFRSNDPNPLRLALRANARGASFLAIALSLVLVGCSSSVVAAHPVPKGAVPTGLSPQAELGRRIFFDPGFSVSGKLSCASCHSPANAYAPANGLPVQLGGLDLSSPGLRAVPSLRYTLARTPVWAHPRPVSLAERAIEKDNGPTGGFGWDGRFDTLHDQAAFPLTNPSEMASSPSAAARRLAGPEYAAAMRRAFGDEVFASDDRAFAAMTQALERFELEDASFHPYTSKYDAYLDGKADLTAQERRGLALFDDPNRGNCSACHLSAKGANGSHPLFTDYQFEALGVPRNLEIAANRKPGFYDLGLCGPLRDDAAAANPAYCGMFKTPTLRNVATRQVFFHNGRFHTLKEALAFYVQRDTDPAKWYGAHTGLPYNDLPPKLRGNVDRLTLPFTPKPGERPVWNETEIDDVIAFLKTLNDADVSSR